LLEAILGLGLNPLLKLVLILVFPGLNSYYCCRYGYVYYYYYYYCIYCLYPEPTVVLTAGNNNGAFGNSYYYYYCSDNTNISFYWSYLHTPAVGVAIGNKLLGCAYDELNELDLKLLRFLSDPKVSINGGI